MLFADAEMREDVFQNIVGGDFASDGAEVVNGQADILTQQVGGDVVLQGCDGRSEGIASLMQGVIVAAVGDDDVTLICCRGVCC